VVILISLAILDFGALLYPSFLKLLEMSNTIKFRQGATKKRIVPVPRLHFLSVTISDSGAGSALTNLITFFSSNLFNYLPPDKNEIP